eukprot:1424989-Prymnesium_polylepis.1
MRIIAHKPTHTFAVPLCLRNGAQTTYAAESPHAGHHHVRAHRWASTASIPTVSALFARVVAWPMAARA